MTTESEKEILQRFKHHPPATDDVANTHSKIRLMMIEVALNLNHLMPPSREASLAQTALQEAAMWANAAVAIHMNKIEREDPS